MTGGAGLALTGLVGCARYGDATTTGASGDEEPATSSGTGEPVAGIAAADVPVGGGVVLAAQRVVVTQPTAGRFVAFGSRCPHQGCSVNVVADGTIDCPCHGSKFNIADGSVARGPARQGLSPRRVRVDAGRIDVV